MAELLTVVAILVVLMAIAGIAISNYIKDYTLNQYDNAAKSIYIAAQNNIADLQASGEWAERKSFLEPSDQKAKATPTDDHYTYYYVTAETARTNGMLPAGSIDDEVRGGAYIIEYCYDTASVYGVFYTENGSYDLENSYYKTAQDPTDRETRRNNNPIIGYYGGADASGLSRGTLEAPTVSAGQSPVLAITDPNIKSQPSLDTSTTVTITKKSDPSVSISLVLNATAPSLIDSNNIYYIEKTTSGSSLHKIEKPDDFLTMSGTDGAIYSINLTQLKSNAQLSSLLADFAAGDEYEVTAKVTTSKAICRPVYGYGEGVWPSTDEPIFTSNIIADYENTADLYVYLDATSSGTSEAITINLENWYNETTEANEDLYYTFAGTDSSINISKVVEGDKTLWPGSTSQSDTVLNHPFEYKYNPGVHTPHSVTFNVTNAAQTAKLMVNVYRPNSQGGIDSIGNPAKQLEITVHVLQAVRNWSHDVEDKGSYFNVIIRAGSEDTGRLNIYAGANLVADKSSPLAKPIGSDGRSVTIDSIPAGGSASIKFFKLNTSITNGGFTFTGESIGG